MNKKGFKLKRTCCILLVTTFVLLLELSDSLTIDQAIPNNLGVNIHWWKPQQNEAELLFKESNFRFVRMDTAWNEIEREKGVYNFDNLDHLVFNVLKPFNARAVLILDYSNPLYDEGLAPHTDEGRNAFAAFAVELIKRYSGLNILFEIWNEPNNPIFWTPKPDAADYAKLVAVTGKAVRAVAPNETIVGPATSQVDVEFVESCFRNGVLDYFDAVSIHPYRLTDPETASKSYGQVASLIEKYKPKDKDIPILSGEWGYSKIYPFQTPERQAKMLPRMFLSNMANGIQLSIWYDWHDDCTDPKNVECLFGLVKYQYYPDRRPCYDFNPSFNSSKTLTTVLKGYEFSETLETSGGGTNASFALLFKVRKAHNDHNVSGFKIPSASPPIVVAWITTQNTTQTISVHLNKYPQLMDTCFNGIDYMGVNLPKTVCSFSGILNVQLVDAPLYLVPLHS